jgi:hypothetical protein
MNTGAHQAEISDDPHRAQPAIDLGALGFTRWSNQGDSVRGLIGAPDHLKTIRWTRTLDSTQLKLKCFTIASHETPAQRVVDRVRRRYVICRSLAADTATGPGAAVELRRPLAPLPAGVLRSDGHKNLRHSWHPVLVGLMLLAMLLWANSRSVTGP